MSSGPLDRYSVGELVERYGASETYAALDRQLERPVTLTRVPLGGVETAAVARWRERLRVLAAATHPALAPVLDTFHAEGAEWIVSERLAGRRLVEAARHEPLAAPEVARVGREVAEAAASLAAGGLPAVGLGRADVVLTGDGQTVLAGLWRPAWDTPAEESAEDDLRALGELLLAAAGGRAADLAAPLASLIARCLGTGGVDAFSSLAEAAAALATLGAAAHPATTAQLTAAGEPDRRSRRSWPVAAVLALLAGGALAAWWHTSARRPLAVAVLPVAPPEESERARLAAAAVNDTATMALATLPQLSLVSGREVLSLRRGGRSDAQIARQLAVAEVVEVKLAAVEGKAGPLLDLERRRADDGRVVWSEHLQADTWEPATLRDTVGELLTGAYRGEYTSRTGRFARASPGAYRLYLTVLTRAAGGARSSDRSDDIALLGAALADSPDFALGWHLLAFLHGQRYQITFRPEDRTAYEQALERARRLGLPATVTLPNEISFLLRTGDTARAAELAEGFVRQNTGNPVAWRLRGETLSQAGRFAEAEAAFARARRLLPAADLLCSLAVARSNRGDHAGARAAIAEARALAGPSPLQTAYEAHIEMYAGDHGAAERLYRELLQASPSAVNHCNLGNCLYYQDRFAEAADSYRRALALVPTNCVAMRNLGDALQALGDREGARSWYEKALATAEDARALGMRSRQTLETRAVCLAQLGRREDAARAADEVMRANPYHPASFYTAALVAAVAGDRASALAWTRRALAANAPPLWFTSPEFAAVAADPAFAALFASCPAGKGTAPRR